MSYKDKVILIIDDEKVSRSTLKWIVEKSLGAQVLEAGDPRQAFEILKDHVPDMILLDMYMPYMSGVEMLEHIRKIPQTMHIPVVACTAYAHKNIVVELARLQIAGIVVKPFTNVTVLEKIKAVLTSIDEAKALPPPEAH